jgi:hypothetical protein
VGYGHAERVVKMGAGSARNAAIYSRRAKRETKIQKITIDSTNSVRYSSAMGCRRSPTTKGNKMITIKLAGSSKNWLKTAFTQGHREAEKAGVAFKDAHILALTPERGRCFVKVPGALTFAAHG